MEDITGRDERRMREATRRAAQEANTSMWLMSAEFTAGCRYETDIDSEAKTDAFVDGAAWALEHLPSRDDAVLRILEKECGPHATDVWDGICLALRRHAERPRLD